MLVREVMRVRVPEVIHAMVLSGLAYQEIQPRLPGEEMAVIDDGVSGMQCYVRRRPQGVSITFRGSNSAKDWRTNLTFWKKTIPYGNTLSPIRVHAGFLKAYKSPAVRDVLHSLMTPEVSRVHICGHSQGGALAILCAVDLQYNFPEKEYVVMSFGSPRVGNRAFAKSYNKRVFQTLRVENGNDIVTKVPPALWGYRHVGVPIRVGMPRIVGFVSFNAHRPQQYLSHLFMRMLPQ